MVAVSAFRHKRSVGLNICVVIYHKFANLAPLMLRIQRSTGRFSRISTYSFPFLCSAYMTAASERATRLCAGFGTGS